MQPPTSESDQSPPKVTLPLVMPSQKSKFINPDGTPIINKILLKPAVSKSPPKPTYIPKIDPLQKLRKRLEPKKLELEVIAKKPEVPKAILRRSVQHESSIFKQRPELKP